VSEQRRRRVDPNHALAGRLRHRNREATVSDSKLDEHPVGLSGEVDTKRDVFRSVRRTHVVAVRESLIPAHRLRVGIERIEGRGAGVPECAGMSLGQRVLTRRVEEVAQRPREVGRNRRLVVFAGKDLVLDFEIGIRATA